MNGAVLNAVAEVRDALTANSQERERNSALKQGVASARNALKVADDQYRNGLTNFNNVIDAQRALLLLEEQQAISEGQMTSNIVRLFKALGGAGSL
jgi:Outer membrane protein